jgi:predicted metal-dependent hydrolase
VGDTNFDTEVLIAEVAKRHKILLDPDDPAFALITINEIVLSRAIAIVEAKLEEMEQRLAQISEKETQTAKAIGEAIITAAATYTTERFKDAGADLIEKVQTSVGLNQGKTQSGEQCSGRTILIYSAMIAAFAAGFLAASLCCVALWTVRI